MRIADAEQRRIEVTGGEVWAARLGPADGVPVLILHGGPGAASYYLEPFAERLARRRPVVVYDQLGCGRSDKPDDTSLWTVDRSCRRARPGARRARPRALSPARAVVGRLAVDRVPDPRPGRHRSGWCWPRTSASIPQFVAEARRLIDELPEPDAHDC